MSEEVLEDSEEALLDAVPGTRQYVTFLVGSEVFAVDMEPIQEIIRMPDVIRVPLAPASMEGLFNLRAKVLPIISLRCMLGFARQEQSDSTRVLIVGSEQSLGFIVDRVASVISVDPETIENIKGTEATQHAPFLSGVIKDAGSFPLVMVLDFTRLTSQGGNEIKRLARIGNSDVPADSLLSVQEQDSDEIQLVSFTVAGQEYAVDIARVQEIVQVPELVVQAPNSAAHVVGLITLRERVLPLVSLRRLFNLPAPSMDESSRIVVITAGSGAVGLVTDNVAEVLRVPKSLIDDMPRMLAKDSKLSDIGQICRLSGGNRLVSIIITEHLFQNAQLENALETCETKNQEAHADPIDEDSNDDEQQIVVFLLGDGEFGALIESVQEIVRVPEELTQVPKAPPFVEGVINLRGSVLPVINQRKRLGLPTGERTDRQRIMVLLLEGVRTGFVVDAVTEVLKVSKSAITESPCSFGKPSRLLTHVVNLEHQKRLVQLIDFACLAQGDAASVVESIDHH